MFPNIFFSNNICLYESKTSLITFKSYLLNFLKIYASLSDSILISIFL